MTDRDTIIRVAREAGFETKRAEVYVEQWAVTRTLERFAALVAAAERERILSMLEEMNRQAGSRHNYYAVAANRIREGV